jgi:hypothetical protein
MTRDHSRFHASRRLREPVERRRDDGDTAGDLAGLSGIVGDEQPDVEIGREGARELHGSDPHARHAGPNGLGREHRHRTDPSHLRPRRRSRNRCSFQVRET